MHHRLLASLCALSLVGYYGCVGDSPAHVPSGSDAGDDDVAPGKDSGGPIDPGKDASNDSATCMPGCDGATLRTCTAPDQTCELGCATAPTLHCARMRPTAPVKPEDLLAAGVEDLAIGTDLFVDTDTGAIGDLRAGNDDPETYAVKGGVGFKLFKGLNVAVLTVKSLTIADTVAMKVRGTAALAVVASGKIIVLGTIDARGYGPGGAGVLCNAATTTSVPVPGPGGSPGSEGGEKIGAGAGNSGDIGGGGGGGFAGAGGNGGIVDSFENASVGGIVVPFPATLVGGFGGGRSVNNHGAGGGGGVQLVSATSIQIGGGSAVGGINVGGCGGLGNNTPGGSGAGSGGMILLQSPLVDVRASGALAANGGSGGAGGFRGNAGNLSSVAATTPASTTGGGGAGAAGATLQGGNGTLSNTDPSSSPAGGGGGGAGYVRIENAAGTLDLVEGATISPAMGTTAVAIAALATE